MASVVFKVYAGFHAASCFYRLYLKGLHAAPVVFEVYTAAPCISRLHLKSFHAAPVVFEGITMEVPCGTVTCHCHIALNTLPLPYGKKSYNLAS